MRLSSSSLGSLALAGTLFVTANALPQPQWEPDWLPDTPENTTPDPDTTVPEAVPEAVPDSVSGTVPEAVSDTVADPTTSETTTGRTQNSSSSTACNNSPDLCNRNYNSITYLGAHNSPFLRDESTGHSLSGNQYLNATIALDAGLRFLQAQMHEGDTPLQLCHSSCGLLDAGTLEDWLAPINDWMEGNPNEVVTILIVNSDGATADQIGGAFDASGLSQFAYTPFVAEGPTGNWPTLQSMIDSNQRLVVFASGVDYSATTPYVLPEFDYVFETAFENTSLGDFDCRLDRPSDVDSSAEALAENYLSLVNHFKYDTLTGEIYIPDTETIETVNNPGTDEVGNLGTHLEQCNTEWGTVPNFVLIDFWDVEEPLEAVDRMNQVSGSTEGRVKAEESHDGGDGGSGASNHGRGLGYGALLAFFSAALVLA